MLKSHVRGTCSGINLLWGLPIGVRAYLLARPGKGFHLRYETLPRSHPVPPNVCAHSAPPDSGGTALTVVPPPAAPSRHRQHCHTSNARRVRKHSTRHRIPASRPNRHPTTSATVTRATPVTFALVTPHQATPVPSTGAPSPAAPSHQQHLTQTPFGNATDANARERSAPDVAAGATAPRRPEADVVAGDRVGWA